MHMQISRDQFIAQIFPWNTFIIDQIPATLFFSLFLSLFIRILMRLSDTHVYIYIYTNVYMIDVNRQQQLTSPRSSEANARL